MHASSPKASLSWQLLLFPLALVLYEFSVYIGNDMIQPGMVLVTREYGVGPEWIARSMTAFLLGGVLLTWALGPLSDRFGRRPIMLGGVLFYVLSCLAILWAQTIESFMLLRLIQGMGLCFIAAVGYATVQEAFAEKTAVKVMALMANVALIAPLAGPVMGAALMSVLPWRGTFVLIALVAAIGFVGLWRAMPETVAAERRRPLSWGGMAADYGRLFSHRGFLRAVSCIVLLGLPLIVWIGLSPVLLMNDMGRSPLSYGLWQFPIIGALIAGNILLIKVTDRWALGRSVRLGRGIMAAGLLLLLPALLGAPGAFYFLVAGLMLMAFTEGLAFAVLYRFALTATTQGMGVIAAAVGMVIMAGFGLLLELSSWLYTTWGISGWVGLMLLAGLLYLWLVPGVVAQAMQQRTAPSADAD